MERIREADVTLCPFCKAPHASASSAACPRCGRLASDHPSIASASGRTLTTDFDDDVEQGSLDLEKGSSVGAHGAGSAYESRGMTFDGDLFDDDVAAPLELDVPQAPDLAFDRVPSKPAAPAAAPAPASAPASPPAPGAPPPPPPASSSPVAAPPSGAVPPPPPSERAEPPAKAPPPPPSRPSAAAVVAGYPPPPREIWRAPVYAAQVLLRQIALRQDLASLRRRRSPDVPLYEAALKAHDARTFAIGLAIAIAALTLASLVFFAPVIIRFLRAPD